MVKSTRPTSTRHVELIIGAHVNLAHSRYEQVRASNPPEKEHPYFARLIAPLLNRVPEDEEEDVESAMGLEEELAEMRVAEKGAIESRKPDVVGKGVGGKGIPASGSGAAGSGQVVLG